MPEIKNKPFKYAIVQHPMWLLIAEDTLCAERTPPWGSPSIEDYAKRLDASVDYLFQFPQLHINFDFSAVELEDLALTYPDMMRKLRTLTEQGRVSFVNGTYSQPHLQILSIESALRQFHYGMASIEDLTGYRVTSYSAQEPGLTPQLPQILLALGFETSSGPSFPYGVKLHGGFVQHWDNHWGWMHGDDFPNWLGIDGSRIPFWLKKARAPRDLDTANEVQHGLLDHCRLRVDIPDMKDVTPEWIDAVEQNSEFCRLDQALVELLRKEPPQCDAEIDANYAYTEGVDAEALSRANTAAETALLTLEAVDAMLGSNDQPSFDYDAAWKLFLKAQHHDAYWTGGPELRAKSIVWLAEVEEAATTRIEDVAKTYAANLPSLPAHADSFLIVRPYSKSAKSVVILPGGAESDHIELGNQSTEVQARGNDAIFVLSSDGLGYDTCSLTGMGSGVYAPVMKGPFTYSNAYYEATVRSDGAIAELAIDGCSIADNVNIWQFQECGQDTFPRPQSARLIEGQVFDSVEVTCPFDTWTLTNRLTFYHALPWFEIETDLDFHEPTEIGDYFDDRTKLHYAWPVGAHASVRHAVGGCPWSARRGRTFVVAPWLDARNDAGGVALCLFNATKCWIDEDGILRFVAAWGHNGDHFHNRQGPLPRIMGPLSWLKPMDLRLRGKHTVKYAVWPHASDVTEGDVADWAASLLLPPVAIPITPGGGNAEASKTFVSLNSPGVVPLSVRRDDDGVLFRMMESAGQSAELNITSEAGWKATGVKNLDGTAAPCIRPYKIVEARLKP